MSLRTAFQKAAQTAVKAFGDVPASVTYLSLATTAAYNTSTGAASTTYSSTVGVKLIFSTFSFMETDGTMVMPKDRKVKLPSLNVSGVECKPKDRIVDGSITWDVVDVKHDSAKAIWTLQVRHNDG